MSISSGSGIGSGAGSINSRNTSDIRTDGAFKLHPEVGAPEQTSKTDIAQSTQQATTQQASDVQPTIVKNLSTKDILKQLANIKVPVNDHNQELAFLMAAHGVEISEDSFALINKLLKGKKSKAAQESAVLLVSKGLGEAVDDVDILANMLNKNSSIATSLENLNQMQGKMQTLLSDQFKGNPSLGAFAAVFDDFNEQLKKLKKVNSGNNLLVNQGELIDDMLAMASFLKGMQSKLNINNQLILKYLNELNKLNQNLLGQFILSEDSIKQPLGLLESFHYFQIPNPLSAQAVIEMLLRKQINQKKSKSKSKQDESHQEKVIISMDTEGMGKITVIVVVMGFKVWCTIYSDKEDGVNHINSFRNELSESLEKYQYKLEEFATSRKKINIQKYVAQSQDISDVKRVQTEI